MARTKKQRLIERAPSFSGFQPLGSQRTSNDEVCLSFEEYESIRLCDYDLLKHEEAANLMNVSRSTFTRIYESSRRKIARAFVEVCPIRLDGGNSTLHTVWIKCSECGISFIKDTTLTCPLCGHIEQLQTM